MNSVPVCSKVCKLILFINKYYHIIKNCGLIVMHFQDVAFKTIKRIMMNVCRTAFSAALCLVITLTCIIPLSTTEAVAYSPHLEGGQIYDANISDRNHMNPATDTAFAEGSDSKAEGINSAPDETASDNVSFASGSSSTEQENSSSTDAELIVAQDASLQDVSESEENTDSPTDSINSVEDTLYSDLNDSDRDVSDDIDSPLYITDEADIDSDSDSLSDFSSDEDESTIEEVVGVNGNYTYINVTWPEFGANGSDRSDDTIALNNALYAAALSASNFGRTIEVYVPAGTYYINNVLHIYSNTWLHLDSRATITRTNQTKEMLAGVHRDRNNAICYNGCRHTGYTQVVNTKVTGGRWNGGIGSGDCGGPVYSRDIITFRHCSDITIADMTIGDDCSVHTVNIDGVRNLTVSNVTFQNHYRYTGSEPGYYGGKYVPPSSYDYWTREALHIDEINFDNWSTAYPLEVLPCMNLTITGCTFRNVVSGLGTHNFSKNNPTYNVMIRGNTFHTVYYQCIHAMNFKDLTVIDNKAYNVTGFLYGKDCAGRNKECSYIQNNTVECGKLSGYPVQDAIYLVGECNVLIENNIFRNIQAVCMHITDGASYKTDTAFSEVKINLNLIENAAGKAGENRNYASILVGRGCKINMWKNRVYLQPHPNGNFETYGVQFNYASKGSIVSKNIIHGGDVGVYLKETPAVSVYSNEVKWTKKFGCYCFRSNMLDFTGNLFMSNDSCGIMFDNCSNVNTWRNAALWNGSKDVWLVQSRPVGGLHSFISNSFVTSDNSQTGVKYVQGDINFDGKLSVHDMQLLSKYLSDPDSALRSEFYMGDINVDGKLTSDDVNVMTRRILS